jgi:uncharacterized membrane protein YeaQ/YmgE (transglycosylase-associated protein family)
MSFSMFVTWVLLGVLAGVLAGLVANRGGRGLKTDVVLGLIGSIGLSWIFRAVGLFPDAGIVAMAFVAFIGAAIAIAAQRKLRPTEQRAETTGGMGTIWRWGLGAALAATVVWMTLGPSGQPAATAASVVEDKTYAVTPAAIKVKAGIVTGEVTHMKVTERVEQGSGRVVSPAKLTANLLLKNSSGNQTVRLVAGKIQYIDADGKPIKVEDMRIEPALRFGTTGSEQLDPGQETIQSLDVDFPAEALKAKRLKEIRLELAYIPSPYHAETVNFVVSISGQ